MNKPLFVAAIAVLSLLSGRDARAQYAYFPAEGTIEYDKTVHAKNLLKRHISALSDDGFNKRYFEELHGRVSETVVLRKKLSFRGSEMSLESVKDDSLDPIAQDLLRRGLLDYQATVYQDLSRSVSRSLFEVGGSTVLVQDSLLEVKWKITNEYRNIAGYDCRRANGLVLDSVYVVAFYTDLIPTPAGPGTVHGLPGMILGLAVPGQHFNIYATKVDLARPDIKTAAGKKRDKPMTRRETREKLKDALGKWMSDRQFDLLVTGMLL